MVRYSLQSESLRVESPERLKKIKAHLELFPEDFPIIRETQDYGLDPILAIHDADYVEYLQTIYPQWYSHIESKLIIG